MNLEPRYLAYAPLVASTVLWGTMMVTFFGVTARRKSSAAPSEQPRVTILKPLAGTDDELRENLESFALLDYPNFELLLGVADSRDPALPVARAFVAAHPELDAKIVMTDPDAARNPKIAQLIGLSRVATGDVMFISDANVRARPDVLSSLLSELLRPGVGLASSVIVGTGERTLGAALENLQLGAQVAPGVISTTVFGERPLTIGKSMMFRRETLQAIGGFGALGGVLAEDHVMARLVKNLGLDIRLSLLPIENRNVGCTFSRTIERHCRWAKMRRAIFPYAYFLEPLLSPLITATVTLLLVPNRFSLLLLAIAAVLQTVAAWSALFVLRGRALRPLYLPLEVVRAYVLFFCWVRAFFSRRVSWRGHPFVLGPDSVLVPAGETLWRRVRRALAV